MKRAILPVLLLCLFAFSASAATKTLTLGDNLKIWFSSIGKDFKKIKTKGGLETVPVYTDRMLDSLSVTGLQVNGTVYGTLAADMQTALTRLKTDIQTVRTKNSDFQKLIDSVIKELRNIANSATPASVASAQTLFSLMYVAADDGEFSDKDKQQINDALADVLATPSLPAANATSLQSAVTALLAGQGVTKADLDLLKSDLASIGNLIKSL